MKGVFNTKTWNSESTTVYKSDLETTTVKPQNTSGYFKCIACVTKGHKYIEIYIIPRIVRYLIFVLLCFLPLLIFKN